MDKVLFSSEKMDWTTPQDFFEQLDKEFNFTLDPCADNLNHKCSKYFTKEQNGLVQDWGGQNVFCNPPYGREIYSWVKKCSEEVKKENTIIVLLIPSRTDTKYFHEFLYKKIMWN